MEVPRGEQGYYVSVKGSTWPPDGIRAPHFADVQAIPLMAKGEPLAHLIAVIGSLDFILPDTDR